MDGIVEYAERELATFDQVALHEVDSLVFSQLCYLWFGEAFSDIRGAGGRLLHDTFHRESFDPLFVGKRAEEKNLRLLTAVASSPRYRDVRVCRYVVEFDVQQETQFSAVTFVLPAGQGSYVAFRGTDSSLVGWKENFNMAFRYPVPGQVMACTYLNEVADTVEGPLYVGGHSKGGNLAIYAATQCSAAVQDRIQGVFDHDAPGFAGEFYENAAFQRVRDRIRKTIPENALVGMLMETYEGYRVVRSDGVAVRQHDPFTWEVDVPARDFVLAQGVSAVAGRGDAIISKWIEPLDADRRGVFVDTLFEVLSATGAVRMGDLANVGRHEVAAAAEVLMDVDAETRRVILEVLGRLVRLFVTPQITWDLGGEAVVTGQSQLEAAQRLLDRILDKVSGFVSDTQDVSESAR